ncbi:MAG: hypothetical protein JXB15_16050 [Anaerolineales bacterium]|nr:hypothetical protein [Anaerolineales bacterium]
MITPHIIVIPGTQGMVEYKDYGFHFRAFLRGTINSGLEGLLIAGIIYLL